MPWFKVDDKLHSHKKAARAGVAAMGLWTVAGSWCADQLTDGFVPDYIAQRLAPGEADQLAERLVTAGLWHHDVHDGDNGWRFNDWNHYQPTREHVEQQRQRERDKKRHQRRTPDGQYAASPRESPGDTAGNPAGVTPSRPDPTRPDHKQERTSPRKRADRATRLPDGWQPTHEPDLVNAIGGHQAAQRELAKFVDYWAGVSGQKGRKVDWQATWRNWLRRASEDRQPKSRDGPAGRRPAVVGSDDWDRQRADQEALERRLLGDTA